MARSRDDVLFAVGVTLWVAIIAVTWPQALSFGDEVGYVGRAKLLLAGHLHFVPHGPGVWVSTPHGVVGKFSLAFSLLLAPLVAIAPRAAFALPLLGAVLLATTARAALKHWGKSPLWGLLVLAQPTIVILARTAMADLPQAAAAACAWWACKRGRAFATVAWLVILVTLKPTGAVLALAIVAGEGLGSVSALRARDATAWRRVGAGLVGGLVGYGLSLALNRAADGTFRSGYSTVFETIKPFALEYLPGRALTHLPTLLLEPPLLLAGAWTFWRRRDFGPLLVIGGYLGMMCLYFFADTGANRLETLILSPRLILPVVAFLLLGYGAWLDDVADRAFGRGSPGAVSRPWLTAALVALPVAVAAGVSLRHRDDQRAMGEVRAVASARADARAGGALGITENACKAGVLHDGPTTIFDATSNRTEVVFCSEISASHRARGEHYSCDVPGYHVVAARDGFFALERDGDARRLP
jgi:hypothetical protein